TQAEWLASLRPTPAEIAPAVAALIDASLMPVTAKGTEAFAKVDTDTQAGFAGRIALMGQAKKAVGPALAVGTNVLPLTAFVGDSVSPRDDYAFGIKLVRGAELLNASWVFKPNTTEIEIAGALAGDIPVAVQYDVPIAGALNWERSPLLEAITKTGQMLSAAPVSLWEPTFVGAITDKPNLLVPKDWDWAPALNALAAYSAVVGRIEVRLPQEITIKSAVTIDVNRIILTGPSKINCKLVTAGAFAVTFNGESATSPYFHNLEIAKNIEFAGNGICNGLRFMGSSSNKAASHLLFNSLNVHDFVDGYSFFNNSYILNFLNCDGFNCTGNVFYMPGGSTNAGERITIIGGTYYNSNRILYAGSGEWYFTNSSFDFSKHLVFAQGIVTFNDCHGEFITGEGYDNIIEVTYFDNMGYQPKCSVIIKGGEWLNLATKSNYVVKFVNATARLACRCIFDRIFGFNIQPLSGYWATGNGRLYVTGLASTAWSAAMSPLTQIENNLLADGGFEDVSATPLDCFYVSADSGTITGRFTSSNLTVSTSNSYAYEGTKSLKIVRTGGVLSNATVSLLVPLTENNVGMRFKMNKPTPGTGAIRIEAYWALAGDLYGAAAPVVRKTLFVDTGASYAFTGATAGWVDYTAFTGWQDMLGMIKYNRTSKEKPAWANCIQIRIVTASMNAGAGAEELYFDKFEVYEL
ncbi:hypothetical protein G3A39_40510, partial [Paraburkholderia aspalathi]|nr:hypothetical protein [Paraburkholderia aspalathi]